MSDDNTPNEVQELINILIEKTNDDKLMWIHKGGVHYAFGYLDEYEAVNDNTRFTLKWWCFVPRNWVSKRISLEVDCTSVCNSYKMLRPLFHAIAKNISVQDYRYSKRKEARNELIVLDALQTLKTPQEDAPSDKPESTSTKKLSIAPPPWYIKSSTKRQGWDTPYCHIRDVHHRLVAYMTLREGVEKAMKNASLMVLAPEMLTMLKELQPYVTSPSPECDDALAKEHSSQLLDLLARAKECE